MARILPFTASRAHPRPTPLDLSRRLLVACQALILGGIALLVLLAVLNTILGAPGSSAGYSP